jgi:hypothetical protein
LKKYLQSQVIVDLDVFGFDVFDGLRSPAWAAPRGAPAPIAVSITISTSDRCPAACATALTAALALKIEAALAFAILFSNSLEPSFTLSVPLLLLALLPGSSLCPLLLCEFAVLSAALFVLLFPLLAFFTPLFRTFLAFLLTGLVLFTLTAAALFLLRLFFSLALTFPLSFFFSRCFPLLSSDFGFAGPFFLALAPTLLFLSSRLRADLLDAVLAHFRNALSLHELVN